MISPSEFIENIIWSSGFRLWKFGQSAVLTLKVASLCVLYSLQSVRKWASLPTIFDRQLGQVLSHSGIFGLLYRLCSSGRLCALILFKAWKRFMMLKLKAVEICFICKVCFKFYVWSHFGLSTYLVHPVTLVMLFYNILYTYEQVSDNRVKNEHGHSNTGHFQSSINQLNMQIIRQIGIIFL